MLLTEHLVRCETGGIDVFTPWYKSCIERLQQIFLQVSFTSWFGRLWAAAGKKSLHDFRAELGHLFLPAPLEQT